jgi:hypothetical protein
MVHDGPLMVHAGKLDHSESEDWPRSALPDSEACAAKTYEYSA